MTWEMPSFNLSGTLNVFRLLTRPSLCLPHATVSTFADLPLPLSRAFEKYQAGKNWDEKVNIRAVVLDKDDCFAVPHENEVYKPYREHFDRLLKAYPPPALLIVSNTAGTSSNDSSGAQASLLTNSTKVPVLRHSTKKPGCGPEIMTYFRSQEGLKDLRESEVAIVGDRLMTDIMMANMMGSWGIWVRDGVVDWKEKSIFTRFERRYADFLTRRGYEAPLPSSPFE